MHTLTVDYLYIVNNFFVFIAPPQSQKYCVEQHVRVNPRIKSINLGGS